VRRYKSEAILRFFDGSEEIDLLASGWKLRDPYWNPQITQLKGGGVHVNPAMAEGQGLVFGVHDNVVETIPLSMTGRDMDAAIKTARDLLKKLGQAENYWIAPDEYDDVWLEVRAPCKNALTGYARVVRGQIPELTNPFGQPFFTGLRRQPSMEGLTLIVEREPFWRAVPPGQIIGPLYNLLRNPDFELWYQSPGVVDSQPDNWADFETLWITGTNNRQETAVDSGNYALRVEVRGSTQAGAAKGVSQALDGTTDLTTYTAVARVRSDGVGNGVGRILVNYSGQLELYRSGDRHGWRTYAATFTTGTGDVVSVDCEILTTAANTDGTVYFDGLMILKGDWVDEVNDGLLPWMSSSHVVNHWDQPEAAVVDAGHINWVDVWDVPGDVDALVRLEVLNDTEPVDVTDQVEVYEQIRVGQRRTRDVTNFDNYHDPPGIADAACSGGDYVESPALISVFQDVTTHTITDDVGDNMGRFRVYARVYDTLAGGSSTLQLRLKYYLGTAGVNEKLLNAVTSEVRGAWTLTDLTPEAAMVNEQKFAPDEPAQLGYALQMRRASTTDEGRVDYVITMPTDGGWLDAETIDPPVSYGNMLIADNTASQMVSATNRRGGFKTAYQTTAVPLSLEVYKGALYIGCQDGELYRYQSIEGELVAEYGTDTLYGRDDIPALEVYDGLLHIAHGDDVLTHSGGESYPATAICTADGQIAALRAFNGELWIAAINVVGITQVQRWDGTTLTDSLATGQGGVWALEVYNNRLYAGTINAARIYEYDTVTGVWTLTYTPPAADAAGVYSLRSFKGRLYAGTGANGRVYVYDGDTWSEAVDLEDIDTVRALTAFDGVLYAAGSPAAALQATADGESWSAVYDPATYSVRAMAVYDGALFIAEDTNNYLEVLAFDSVQYKVPDYKGGAFTSPHTKRHRYVFAYDRQNGRNVTTDKVRVGLGFVPRYKSLIAE
jgi:hypothetical protein